MIGSEGPVEVGSGDQVVDSSLPAEVSSTSEACSETEESLVDASSGSIELTEL